MAARTPPKRPKRRLKPRPPRREGPLPETRAARVRDWRLWEDWCGATDQAALPVTVRTIEAFLEQVPAAPETQRRRLLAVREHSISAGHPWPITRVSDTSNRFRTDVDPRVVGTALEYLDVTGFPKGYRGRRDAWLIVLLYHLGFTRREALEIGPSDIDHEPGTGIVVRGRLVEADDHPDRCPACAVWRWLEVAQAEADGFRIAVRELLVNPATSGPEGGGDHVCDRRADEPPSLPELGPNVVLSPAIDKFGWASTGRSISPRGLNDATRVARETLAYQDAPTPDPDEVEDTRPIWEIWDEEDDDEREAHFGEDTFDRLDEACERADEVNARIDALLSEFESGLKKA